MLLNIHPQFNNIKPSQSFDWTAVMYCGRDEKSLRCVLEVTGIKD